VQAVFPVRQRRTHYRHEPRTLTYITLDAANGGIVRNLSHDGLAVQAVAPLREQQRVRLRFELGLPRLRIDAWGLVSWANSSGQCGIRFLSLPIRTRQQINQWIFSSLLEGAAMDRTDSHALLNSPSAPAAGADKFSEVSNTQEHVAERLEATDRSNWLSRPLAGRALARVIDGLILLVALLLFALIFLSMTHELPPWPLALSAGVIAAASITAAYRTLFAVLGESSVGVRLAEAASAGEGEQESASRFR
jgi:hypothetical protein